MRLSVDEAGGSSVASERLGGGGTIKSGVVTFLWIRKSSGSSVIL
jgi:hypothetical protein